MTDSVISVENLSKRYVIGHESRHDNLRDTLHHTARKLWRRFRWGTGFRTEEFWALRDVSFEVKPGEVVGIIGRNGAGKSTLLKILSRITEPTAGRVTIRGRVASLLEVGTGFHGELSGRENVFLNGAILGMKRAEIRRKFDEIVAFAEVEKFLDTPVKYYSSGMYVRLAFAVAAHLDPEILIIDEVLAVGDVQFQRKCLGKMDSVAKENGRTVLFVSHNLQHIRQLCSCGLLLQAGQKSFHGNVHTALNTYYRQLEAPLESARRPDKCRIVNIRFTDGTGHQVERITRQETLWFSIELELGHDVRQPLVSVAVLHGDRQAVFSENWAAPAPLRAGTHRLQGCFDAAHLKCEQYFLTAFLFNGETCLDRVDGLSLPEITDAFADPLVESRRWGVARIAINWQMNSTAK